MPARCTLKAQTSTALNCLQKAGITGFLSPQNASFNQMHLSALHFAVNHRLKSEMIAFPPL